MNENETTAPPAPQTVRLRAGGDFAENAQALRATIFGEQIRLAMPTVENYWSDLYHDAGWMQNFVTGPSVWFWSVGVNGTHIGIDQATIRYAAGLHSDSILYRVELSVDERQIWSVTFTPNP